MDIAALTRSLAPLMLAGALASGGAAAQEVPVLPDGPQAPDMPPPLDDAPEPGDAPPALLDLPDETLGRDAQLDALFAQLAEQDNPHWQIIQGQIWRVWRRSGSDSMDFLLARALEAMEGEDYETALVHLDDLTRLAPDFAEGWNQRATLHFMRGDYGRAMLDIERVLALEPRHFGALSGLGIILDRTGYDGDALAAYRRALELNPHLEGAQQGADRLAPDVDGRDL